MNTFWMIVLAPFLLTWLLLAIHCWRSCRASDREFRRWLADFRRRMEELEFCPGCHCQIDTSTCCCGSRMSEHDQSSNHQPRPLGCQCGRAE